MSVALTLQATDRRTPGILAARRWWLALAASMLVHAFVLSSPGWRLPTLDELLDPDKEVLIEARLAPPPAAPVAAAAPPPPAAETAPAPPPRAESDRQRRPAVTPARPVASVPGLPAPAQSPAQPAAVQAAEAPATSAPPAAAATLPKRARIRYAIMLGGQGLIVGRAEHRWTLDGSNYTLRAMAETTGLAALFKPATINQVSEGDMLAEGLRPRTFRVERSGVTGDSATFDWASGRVAMSPGPRDSVAEPGMQDMLSLFWQLGLLPVSPTGMALTVATGKKIERYVFALSGEEKISTALGEKTVLHLKTIGTSGGDATEIWIDVAKRLPLRIRHADRKGEVFDQVVEEMEIE